MLSIFILFDSPSVAIKLFSMTSVLSDIPVLIYDIDIIILLITAESRIRIRISQELESSTIRRPYYKTGSERKRQYFCISEIIYIKQQVQAVCFLTVSRLG